jgi:hypothetical protein
MLVKVAREIVDAFGSLNASRKSIRGKSKPASIKRWAVALCSLLFDH